jgi:4-hydroxybenzoate polyprenyltransferase
MEGKKGDASRPWTAIPHTPGILASLRLFLETIRFSHTIFALPFALTGAVLAARGIPSLPVIFWILMAMVGARTAAMGLNRLIDAEIDGKNPRTKGRAIPSGLLRKKAVAVWIGVSVALFLLAAYQLNPLCFSLTPVAIFLLVSYSYCKRFTSLCHVVLGLCLAAAPVGSWIAVRGNVEPAALLLGGAVLFWVAGFDILYALQDLDFDRTAGLHSIPVRIGTGAALLTARLFHLVTVGMLAAVGFAADLGIVYLVGVGTVTALLGYEHSLVREGDLSRLNTAFFTANSYISCAIFLFTLTDILSR